MSASPAPPPRPRPAPSTDPCPPPWDGEGDALYDHERGLDTEVGDGPADEDRDADELIGEPDDQADDDGEVVELPMLDEAVMADDDLLACAVDEVIATDPAARAVQRQLVNHQEQLQQQLAPEHWARVLALDELTTARWADLTLVLVRWAWAEGRRVALEGE